MDAATLELLGTSLTHVLADDTDAPLDVRLRDLGWDEVLADDAPAALHALFTAKGTTLAGADALGPVLAGAIADAVADPALATATVVLPTSLHPDRESSRAVGEQVVVDGLVTTRGERLLVPVDGKIAVIDGSALELEPVLGIDPSLGYARVRGEAAAARWLDRPAWDAAVAVGRWTVAAELVSIGRTVVAAAVAYTGERSQYGRPIGSFQALQHRLASAHASLVGAASVVAEAAATASQWTALVAKALAGRAAEDACTQAQQSYGAIGFTWEHDLHRYLRRTYVLDWTLGDWRTLEREIGATLVTTRAVPRIGGI